MFKFIISIFSFCLFLFTVSVAAAENNNFITIVNPVRGGDFWELVDQSIEEAVFNQAKLLQTYHLPATFLLRFDVLTNQQLVSFLQNTSFEKGLFLEITPSWCEAAGVKYQESAVWHQAGSVFLTGYSVKERAQLIDAAMIRFKNLFGYYPTAVGSWYIDAWSLDYLQQKYQVKGALIVADQYSTDNYQIWGQYWQAPYYPSATNTLTPAQTKDNKIPLVVMQWAARDPINGYGDGVQESTYSVQANDYLDYHNLDISYFEKLLDIYLGQKWNQVNQVVVGLENSYQWSRYASEYERQLQAINRRQQQGQVVVLTMTDFASWYMKKFPDFSPTHLIWAKDPLGRFKEAIWLMNPYYRVGWFYNKEGSVFRDIRQYTEGWKEPCLENACKEINFATFPVRVLDDVTYKQKLVLDQGKIYDIFLKKLDDKFVLAYKNEAGGKRQIEFLPRDIGIDGKIYTIDALILKALSQKDNIVFKGISSAKAHLYRETIAEMSWKIVKFLGLLLVFLIPGLILTKSAIFSLSAKIFISLTFGMVFLTLLYFIFGYLKISWLIYLYLGVSLIWFIFDKSYQQITFRINPIKFWPEILLIFCGTFFQSLSTIRSGWVYDFGLGFWGPLGHDGIWHQALIQQLIKNIPPQNPIFAGHILSNYHYFFDLLIAASFNLTNIPILDLLYRFYPILFSLLLGLGTYVLLNYLTKNRTASLISLYFVYFAGSFGWIVEFLKERHFGGESAFWVNQPVSMNLNPPFAISLIVMIAIILMIQVIKTEKKIIHFLVLTVLAGSLIEFKVYGGAIVLLALFLAGTFFAFFKKSLDLLMAFFGSLVLSLVVFLPQNIKSGELLVFSPFWFIHSMIDFPDRVGWARLALMRDVGYQKSQWWKILIAETVAFLIFVMGNLGMRLMSLGAIWTFIKNKLWQNEFHLFFCLLALISFVIPVFFIQKGNPWNTIQFFYYFLYLLAVLTGLVVVSILQKLPKIIKPVFLVLILIITPINAFVTFQTGFYSTPPSYLTIDEYEALTFLQKQKEGIVLTYPFDRNLKKQFTSPYPLLAYETTAYVSAFSGKTTFFEDEIQLEIFQNDFQKRKVATLDFFAGRDQVWSRNFLTENKIKYIYLPKIHQVVLESDKLGLKSIYQNPEVEIFEVL